MIWYSIYIIDTYDYHYIVLIITIKTNYILLHVLSIYTNQESVQVLTYNTITCANYIATRMIIQKVSRD